MRRIVALALVGVLMLGMAVPAAEAHHHAVGIAVASTVGFVLAAPFLIAGAILAPLVPHPPVYHYAPAPVPGPVVVPPQAAYAPPVYRAPAYAPPAYASAPPPVDRAPRVAPNQAPPRSYARTVEYPHGRYELHGDGISTPYRWVWIPNAPPPPGGDMRWASR